MERGRGGKEQGVRHASAEEEDRWLGDSGVIRRNAPSSRSVCSDMKICLGLEMKRGHCKSLESFYSGSKPGSKCYVI